MGSGVERPAISSGPATKTFFDRMVMGLWPTGGDEKTPSAQQPLSVQQELSMEAPLSPLSSRAQPRDLRFSFGSFQQTLL
jgi:hypothetical protein